MREHRHTLRVEPTILIPDVRNLFWEYDKRTISWKKDKELILKKILHYGTWDAICWVRKNFGDDELREWIILHHGIGLDAKRLSYWQLILNIPKKLTNEWIAMNKKNPWSRKKVK